jgi:hypothetical protein
MMKATGDFFSWWFTQWNIGGWVIFVIIAIGAVAWLVYDTQTRRIRAVGWLMGAILPAMLLLPSAYVGLSGDAAARVQRSLELFFYIGLIGGIVPIVVAVGYFITYKDTKGCERGHIYDASLPECPVCAQERAQLAQPSRPEPRVERRVSAPPPAPEPKKKPKVSAWLVEAGTNRSHQLSQGDTRIGRSKDNEIVFNDKAVSREHMLIREDRGHFTLYDRGAKTGTYVNGTRVEAPMLLAHDDEIEVGDTRLRFITSR